MDNCTKANVTSMVIIRVVVFRNNRVNYLTGTVEDRVPAIFSKEDKDFNFFLSF